MSASGKKILVGEIGRAHGLKGEVRLKSFTQDPLAIKGYGPFESEDGKRRFILTSVKPLGGGAPDMLIARFEGVTSREAAESLTLTGLCVPRERLDEAAANEDEYLQADLVGLRVEDAGGTLKGHVVGIANYGAGDLLEVKPAGRGATVLLPFQKAFVPFIDLAGGRIVVEGEGLFEPPEGQRRPRVRTDQAGGSE